MRFVQLGVNHARLIIENDEFYFSYNTCVGISNKFGRFRIESPSRTTSRHMSKMGINNWLIISKEKLAEYFPKTV